MLSVKNLTVDFPTDDGVVHAVDDVSFDLMPQRDARHRRRVGIGQERHVDGDPRPAAEHGAASPASMRFRGEELLGKSENQLQPIRGQKIAMIFQDALDGAEPGVQGRRPDRRGDHGASRASKRTELHERVIELLDLVGHPERRAQRVDQYPHEYSGGMRQRAMIAMSIANEPDVLIADEPTTALDVTIQAQVLEVLERIQDRTKSSIILITHDLGVVAGVADRVMVMYAGRQVELGRRRRDLLPAAPPVHAGAARVAAPARPAGRRRAAAPHPGSAAVADLPAARLRVQPALPARDAPACATPSVPAVASRSAPDHVAACVRVDEIAARSCRHDRRSRSSPRRRRKGAVVVEVDRSGEELPDPRRLLQAHDRRRAGRVGRELHGARGGDARRRGRVGLRQVDDRSAAPAAHPGDVGLGEVSRAAKCSTMKARELRELRGKIQFVFQDPYASLNPRMTVHSIISEPMRIHGTYKQGRQRSG